MGDHDRMKAADTYFSIHPYTFIASYKKFASKRIGMATNKYYKRDLHGKRHDLTWLTFFGHFQNSVMSLLQMPEL